MALGVTLLVNAVYLVQWVPRLPEKWNPTEGKAKEKERFEVAVELSYGTFVGSIDEHGVMSWLGLPYAEPPVGDLRFMAPKRIDRNFSKPTSAFKVRSSCMQEGNRGIEAVDEDCLYLNVWAPRARRAPGTDANTPFPFGYTELLPVMVFIHGGTFMIGGGGVPIYSSGSMVRRASSVGNDIILVTINYRLALFGFFGTEEMREDGAAWNAGLLDQRIAFQWVKEHISRFGGDPDRITAFGESAGAMSLASHLTARSPPFFHRVILQSGSGVLTRPLSQTRLDAVAKHVRSQLNCSRSQRTLACLRDRPAGELLKADLSGRDKVGRHYGVLVEGKDGLVDKRPSEIVARGARTRVRGVEVMLGVTRDDGSIFAPGVSKGAIKEWMKHDFPALDLDRVMDVYGPDDSDDRARQISFDLMNDFLFECGQRLLADSLTRHARPRPSDPAVYMYSYNHRPRRNHFGVNDRGTGVYHTAELMPVFGDERWLDDSPPGPPESWISDVMVGYWTNFAYSGDPNVGREGRGRVGTEWPRYVGDWNSSNGGGQRVRFDDRAVVVENVTEAVERCKMWGEVFVKGEWNWHF
ncbi:hypothetical protein HK101_001163 [Irineochytrium annulatum]|nr:hypothetical protein HK101_001163 [Irineochytrium annulatum]